MASTMECKVDPDLDCVLDLTCSSGENPAWTNPANNLEATNQEDNLEVTNPEYDPPTVSRKPRKRRREVDDDEDDDSETKRLIANSQERVRMQKLNQALEELKKALPPHFHVYQKRMSKIRTLRLAMNYIAMLSELIQRDNARRETAYRQTLQYIQEHGHIPQFSPDGVLVNSIHPMAPDYVPVAMAPSFHTPGFVTPYHTYVSTMYGLADSSSTGTPVQTPPRHRPRQLDFHSITKQEHTFSQEQIIAGSNEIPIKSEKSDYTRMEAEHTFLNARKYHKTATFTSPFLGSRNQNELDISFLSTGSDSNREDTAEPVRMTSLEDIIDGDEHDDRLKTS